jgi:RimJ/RimL family protein N-acetyltransferase
MSKLFPKEFTLKNDAKLVVRQAQEQDAENLLAFTQGILQEDEFFITTLEDLKQELTLDKTAERIQKHLDKVNWCYLLGVLEGSIVGQIHLNSGPRKRIEHVCQVNINVHKEYRGLGIGTALMKSVVFWAQDNAVVEKLTLEVFPDNEIALGLYRKMGFIEEGRNIKAAKFSPSKYKDCILMYKFVK